MEIEAYLEAIKELDAESPGFVVLLEDIAEHFDVSVTTAYHKMEGLTARGLIEKLPHQPGYRLKHIVDPL